MEIYHPRDEELLREMRRVRRSDRRKRLAIGMAVLLVLSAAFGLFVFHRYYQLAVMHGPAMGDTLPEGSLVLVRKPETEKPYVSGDIILYEKRIATPVEITILNEKGKIRDYCSYIIFRDIGTTRQYYAVTDGTVSWVTAESDAEKIDSDAEGVVRIETENLPNGEYWLKEVKASYGQKTLSDPIPFPVRNPVRTQMKRILAAPGDRVVTSPYAETRLNGQEIDTSFLSGRTADAAVESRRLMVAKDRYFVQGDQLSLSLDSREVNYGYVAEEEILGRAEFAIWPLRCFGSLTGRAMVSGAAGQEGAE